MRLAKCGFRGTRKRVEAPGNGSMTVGRSFWSKQAAIYFNEVDSFLENS